MLDPGPSVISVAIFVVVTAILLAGSLGRGWVPVAARVRYLWTFLLLLTVADWFSPRVAIWLFAGFSFVALREFFTLVDIRLQDRWGILGAYLSIPFMSYFIHIDWYGMFIISIPVYTFLLIPLLVTLGGGDSRGTVFSIGVIDLGLFLFVYCMGHIAYLARFSVRMAIFVVVSVAFCDLVCRRLAGRSWVLRFGLTVAGVQVIALSTSLWTAIPWIHSAMLGLIIPFLVLAGSHTLRVMEEDLGVTPERLEPGRGAVLDSLQAYLLPAPIAFHYLRWFLDWGSVRIP